MLETVAYVTANCGDARPPKRGGRKQRARISNHPDLLPDTDGNLATTRRFRDLVTAYITDLGGLSECSEIKIGLVRRLAATTIQSELLEAKMINGAEVDIGTLCNLASTVMRLSSRLGLERKAKTVTPDFYKDVLPALAARPLPAAPEPVSAETDDV